MDTSTALMAGIRTYGQYPFEDAYLPPLPGSRDPVVMAGFVPNYRCGPVPDLHRVPFHDAPNNPYCPQSTRTKIDYPRNHDISQICADVLHLIVNSIQYSRHSGFSR